jgi:hypothetical protein
MAATLTVRDETTSGERGEAITLEFPTERVTVREIIRARVYQEVEDYNRKRADDGRVFRGLVQPTDTERELNGYRVKSGREIDRSSSSRRRVRRTRRIGCWCLWVINRRAGSMKKCRSGAV